MENTTILEIWRSIRTFIRWGGIICIVYIISNSVIALADKELIKINLLIKAVLSLSANFYISWGITISATIYGYLERRLRRKKIKQMSERINTLERMLWKDKSSSKINLDGTTNQEDI